MRLHPDDIRYEARQPAITSSDQLYEVVYRELVEELRHSLSFNEEAYVPVYPFGYDWRQPLAVTEAQLADFVDEVIDRTALLRHYHVADYRRNPKVNLVGHSMGGLIIAGYIENNTAEKVDRVATLASPFQGSFEAMVKLTTGTANMGGDIPSPREREAARVTPSLYHLLPNFETGMSLAEGADFPRQIFDTRLWQPSIIDTVIEYVRRYGIDPVTDTDSLRTAGETLFASLLRRAKDHRARLDRLNLVANGLSEDRWLCIVGVDASTRVRMTIENDDGAPYFRLRSRDRLNFWDREDNQDELNSERRLTGDGTVHFNGAVPNFLSYKSLVCVSPDDFGYWEVVDKSLIKMGGFHGILPNMNMLHRLLARYFTGADDLKHNTWGRPAPGVTRENWAPPVQPLRPK